MSNDFEFRKHMRDRKRKQKIRKTLFMSVGVLALVAVLIFGIRGILISRNTKEDAEFIFNGYIYPQPPEKNEDILVDAVKADGEKKAYLTFDDGPNNSVTPEVLDVLRRYNVKATFFLVGTLIEKNPDVARRLYDEGHCLANHSYNHNYDELYADSEAFMTQVKKTEELIKGITCDEYYPKVFRFPGGGYQAGKHGDAKQEYKTAIGEAGYRYCDWNSLTGDAESKSPSADSIIERLKKTTDGKEDIVILMHDAIAKKITAQTLPQVLEYLISQGYSFDTLDNV